MKALATRFVLTMAGRYLRGKSSRWGKTFFWQRFCVPYLSWRDTEVVCRTISGGRFYAKPIDFVENRLCFFGTWEPAITAQFQRLLKSGDIVLDVGANIGYYSVLASKLVGPEGKVIAFEPSPSIRQRLSANLELNAIENVSVVPYAAWYENGQAVLNLVDGNRGSSTLGQTSNSSQSESVELKRLDEMIPDHLVERIRLLKIDVEGAEWAALQGASGLLERAKNIAVICEVCPERIEALSGSLNELLSFMSQRGFHAIVVPNDYSAASYISGKVGETSQLQLPLDSACDVLFQRD